MKPFLEVFPTLQLKAELKSLLEQVEVERLSMSPSKDFLRIYLTCNRLVEKNKIWFLEEEIEKQLLAKTGTKVKIYEKFVLSSQYNPEKLMQVYGKWIYEEIRAYSPVEYSILKKADVQYPEENVVRLVLEDTVLAKGKAEEIVDILIKILNERCGFSVHMEVAYKEKKQNERMKEVYQKVDNQVAEIVAKLHRGEETAAEQEVLSADTGKVKEEKTETQKSAEKKSDEKGAAEKKTAEKNYRPLKRSDNPDVIYGTDTDEEAMSISDIAGEIGEVVIRGKIMLYDEKEIPKIEKTIVMLSITDYTDSIKVKFFVRTEQIGEIKGILKDGPFVKIKGIVDTDKFDHELTIGSVSSIKKIPDFTTPRMDNSVRKRVELHCHTKMSDMDGVSDVKDIVNRAYKWGMPAIAITDHGVVQAFPDANHAWEKHWYKELDKKKAAGEKPDKFNFFKVIYGVEGYLVDDLKTIVVGDKGQSLRDSFVVFDIETTGFSPIKEHIIEIGAVKVENGVIVDRFSRFVNPQMPIPFRIEQLTGIRDDMVADADTIDVVLPAFLEFCEDCVLVAHNAEFDMSFIKEKAERLHIKKEFTYVDTMGIARLLLTEQLCDQYMCHLYHILKV